MSMRFFAVGEAIVRQLDKALNTNAYPEDTINVFAIRSRDMAVQMAGKKLPAVMVSYGMYRVVENTSRGRRAQVTQSWDVVIAVRNYAQFKTRTGALEDIDALIDRVLMALLGFEFDGTYGCVTLKLDNPPALSDEGEGTTYFPLRFTTEPMFISNQPES